MKDNQNLKIISHFVYLRIQVLSIHVTIVRFHE